MASVLEGRYPRPRFILQPPGKRRYKLLVGIGGIGNGIFFALAGDETLGRNESRPGRLLDLRDYCKGHIVAHYVAVLLGAGRGNDTFEVFAIGKVGDDDRGRSLIDEMKQVGIDTRFVQTVDDRPTMLSCCFQYPDGSGGNITDSNSASATLTAEDVERAEAILAQFAGKFIALAAPEVPIEARARLLDLATKHQGFRAGSFASAEIDEAIRLGMFEQLDLLSVNEDEAAAIAGVDLAADDPEPLLEACAEALVRRQADIKIIVTAGARGAYGYSDGAWQHCPAPNVPIQSTAGAGDALLAGAIAGLAAGLPLIEPGAERGDFADQPLACALDMAVLLASLTVGSPHTIRPDASIDAMTQLAEGLGVEFSAAFSKRFQSSGQTPAAG